MRNETITVDGHKWLVREAVSLEAAARAIANARCNLIEHNKETTIIKADVVRLDEDGKPWAS